MPTFPQKIRDPRFTGGQNPSTPSVEQMAADKARASEIISQAQLAQSLAERVAANDPAALATVAAFPPRVQEAIRDLAAGKGIVMTPALSQALSGM